MKQLLALTMLFAGLSLLPGCSDSPTTVEPTGAVESPEKTAAEQAEYDREMAEAMRRN